MKKTKKMKTLVIKMDKWLRGESNSYLLRPEDGKQCCLGFLARSCGASEEEIEEKASPACTAETIKWPKRLLKVDYYGTQNSSVCGDMMEVNDDNSVLDTDRIKKLRPLFAKIGYKLIFKAK